MNYTEEAVFFACEGETLFGILAKPDTPKDIGVVVIVGGPQYRAGSHRQFVLLSRALAAAGYAVLRFDFHGMGDSGGPPGDFETVSQDVAAAIDALHLLIPAMKHVALWGLCDGASAALLYCHERQDPRVAGLMLLNPWVRSEASQARTQVKHYYTQRLRQKEFWLKLIRGQVAAHAVSGLVSSLKRAFSSAPRRATEHPHLTFQQKMAAAWRQFKGKILLILSGDDYTAKEFLEYAAADAAWSESLAKPGVSRHGLPNADHTFSTTESNCSMVQLTLRWLEQTSSTLGPHIDFQNHLHTPNS